MRRTGLLWLAVVACSGQNSAEDQAKSWLLLLARGDSDAAYQGLCAEDQQRIAAVAQRQTGELPSVFLARLKGRYAGIDEIVVLDRNDDRVRLAVVTKKARLPLSLRRRGEAYCVAFDAEP